tara:strand:- start:27 stop:734 length:708 start_codon:yes stop_codon:yes gene_type:complete
MNLQNQIELELYFADHFDTILYPVLADIYLEQNDLKRARKVCEIGLKHYENDPSGLFILAQVEKSEGNLKETESALELVLLYSADNLAAAEMLCEIQTVLGRASSRLLKSWKHVLALDPSNKTAKDFVKKVDETSIKKKTITTSKKPEKQKTKQKSPKQKPSLLKSDPTLDMARNPLKVSSRLATFTLVTVLNNQGLYGQALEVLDALEKKGENPETIARERESIQTLMSESHND